MKESVLEIRNLCKSYGEKKVLDDLSLDFYLGEIIGIIGENAVGKTTLLKCILGLVEKDFGEIVFQRSQKISCGKGLPNTITGMIESPALYDKLTVCQNIKLYIQQYEEHDFSRMSKVIEMLNIQDYLDYRVDKLSLGTKQKVYIAMVLSIDCQIIILDEPMNGLDPTSVKKLRDHLINLAHKENKCILLSSHILSECEKVCDKVLFMKKNCETKLVTTKEINASSTDAWIIEFELKEDFEKMCKTIKKEKLCYSVNADVCCIEITNVTQEKIISFISGLSINRIERKTNSLEQYYFAWK